MKAIIIPTKSQYTLTRTSSGHLAVFITVLIKETSGSHEEPSSTAVWQTQACQLNKKCSLLHWLQAQRDIGDKEHRKIQVSQMWTNANPKTKLFENAHAASVLTESQQQEVEMQNIIDFKSLIFPKNVNDEGWKLFFIYVSILVCLRVSSHRRYNTNSAMSKTQFWIFS